MNGNIEGLLIVITIFGGGITLIIIGMLLYKLYKKYKRIENIEGNTFMIV
jgi:hypothetical protein